jgi:outer membrane protein TolC
MKVFKNAGLVSEVELYQLKAALENVKYNLNSLDLQKKTLLSQLSLKVGKTIKRVSYSHFRKKRVSFYPDAQIKSLQAKMASLYENAKVISAANNPKVNLSLEHNQYAYDRTDRLHPEGLNSQTTLSLSGTMRVYDGGVKKRESEAMKLQAMSLSYQIKYSLKEQKINFKLSKLRISNVKTEIKSAKSSLRAAQKNYNAILKKYNAGIIDNTGYLDALSNLAQAKANYKKALYDLDVAYAIYYFNAGRDIRNFVQN